MARITPPIKYHGGKHYLADWIISHFPRRYLTYCEPYFGGGAVLLKLNPNGHSEVINDIDGKLMNFWKVMQTRELFDQFFDCIKSMPFSEELFNVSPMATMKTWVTDSEVRQAIHFFIRCRQSLAGRKKSFTPISTSRTRSGMNEQVSSWMTAIEGLPTVHQRLIRVLMLKRDAIDCIMSIDHRQTIFYCDPPYLHETRKAKEVYGEFEMGENQHQQLLECLDGIAGKFILSGYRSKLYDSFARKAKWRRRDLRIANNAAGGKSKRVMVESIWMNY